MAGGDFRVEAGIAIIGLTLTLTLTLPLYLAALSNGGGDGAEQPADVVLGRAVVREPEAPIWTQHRIVSPNQHPMTLVPSRVGAWGAGKSCWYVGETGPKTNTVPKGSGPGVSLSILHLAIGENDVEVAAHAVGQVIQG